MPKKRTFLSRRTSLQSGSSGPGSDTQAGGLPGVVPAPRRSLQRGSSGSSNQSCLKGQDEMPPSIVLDQVSQPAQPAKSLDESSQQPLCDTSQVSSNSSQSRNPPSLTRDRSVEESSNDSHLKMSAKLSHPPAVAHNLHYCRSPVYGRSEASTDREMPQKSIERNNEAQRERAAVNTVILDASSIQDSDRENSVGTALRQEELSLPQSTVGEFKTQK